MFHPNGWVSLREIFEFVTYAYLSDEEYPKWGELTGDENFELVWEFCEEAQVVGVVRETGEVVTASKALVLSDNTHDHSNRHTNLMIGTVGSSDHVGRDGKMRSLKKLREEYGPFLHLPIVFKKNEFHGFLEEFENRALGREGSQPPDKLSPSHVSKCIIRLFDEKGAITLKEAKNRIAPSISHRAFRLAWDLAREQRPELSKPGRRPRIGT